MLRENLRLVLDSFNQYLDLRGSSVATGKNYTSDLCQFLFWLASKKRGLENTNELNVTWFAGLNSQTIEEYKTWLIDKQLAVGHINRKLSSLRTFFYFAIDQRWLLTNPAKKISNITSPKTEQEVSPPNNIGRIENQILKKFAWVLGQDKLSSITVKNYLSDVRQFLLWLKVESQES